VSKAEQYRERAKEAEELAARARDVEAKRIYLEIAERWRRAAELENQGSNPFITPPEPHPQPEQQPQQKIKREDGDS